MRGIWYETNALISCRLEFTSSPSALITAVFGESQITPFNHVAEDDVV